MGVITREHRGKNEIERITVFSKSWVVLNDFNYNMIATSDYSAVKLTLVFYAYSALNKLFR